MAAFLEKECNFKYSTNMSKWIALEYLYMKEGYFKMTVNDN